MSRRMGLAAGGALAVAAVVAATSTWAQPAAPEPAGTPEPLTLASPDRSATWTIQGENASISTARLTDRYYVNGIRVGFTSGTDVAPDAIRTLGDLLFGPGQTRLSLGVSQQLYTAAANTVPVPPPGDRPYAATLLAHAGLVQDSADTRSTLDLDVGILGPSALGEPLQNGFHDLIGQNRIKGWRTQIKDEPVGELTSSRVWRLPMGTLAGQDTDALLTATAGVGTIKDYVEVGGQVRFGSGLASDFGAPRIQPGLTGGDAFRQTRPLVYYAFAGVGGQAIGHNELLDGQTFRSHSQSVHSEPFVAEFQGGAAMIYHGVRISYTQALQTNEFRHQKGGLHQFGSLALSVRF